jgi:hypothetical protein
MGGGGMFQVHEAEGRKKPSKFNDEWLTPPAILSALGSPDAFDLDPCSPGTRPWPTAKDHISLPVSGLAQPWSGNVWLNPPYGAQINQWMKKMAWHGSGIALVFARTETEWFREYAFKAASGFLFIHGRLNFYHVSGERSKYNSGAPSVLISYDNKWPCPNRKRLQEALKVLNGTYLQNDTPTI